MLDLYQYGGLVAAILTILAFACLILLAVIITISRKYFMLRKEHKYEKALSIKEATDKLILHDNYEIVNIVLDDLINQTKNDTDLQYKLSMLRSIYTILELNPAKATELKEHIIAYGKYGMDIKSSNAYAIKENLSIFPEDTRTALDKFYELLNTIDPTRDKKATDVIEAKTKVQHDPLHKKIKKDAPAQVQGKTPNKSIFDTDADCVSIDYSEKTKSYLNQMEKEAADNLADYARQTD